MTKDEVNKKIKAIIDEYVVESQKIIAEAKEKGIWVKGLDGDKEFFSELDNKAKKQIQDVINTIDEN